MNANVKENPVTVETDVMCEREEGEISDLDLEDVSDCSLNIGKPGGKQHQSQGYNSFSSISDTDSNQLLLCVNFRNTDEGKSRHHRIVRRKQSKYRSQGYSRKNLRYTHRKRSECSSSELSSSDTGARSNSLHVRHKYRRRVRINSDGSIDSDSDTINKSLLKKLNKAVRVNKSEMQQTSLSTRLKNMANVGVDKCDDSKSSDSEYDLKELRQLALQSKDFKKQISLEDIPLPNNSNNVCPPSLETPIQNCDNISSTTSDPQDTDNRINGLDEAFQLRIDALKSAIMKKHIKRHKNKQIAKSNNLQAANLKDSIENDQIPVGNLNTRKEDDINLIEYVLADNDGKNTLDSAKNDAIINLDSPVETLENNKENETVEGILPEKTAIAQEQNKTVDEDEDILRAMLLSSISKKVTETNIPNARIMNTLTSIPKIEKFVESNVTSNNLPIQIPIQRLIINVGDDSDDTDSEDAKTPVNKLKFEQSLSQLLKEERAKVDRQQAEESQMLSAMKRLPQSKQAEYIALRKRMAFLDKARGNLSSQTILLQKKANSSCDTKISKVRNNKNTLISKSQLKKTNINKVLITNKTLNKLQNELPIHANKTSVNQNETQTTQKRFLEGKYMNLAPIVKRTKAVKQALDQARMKVTQLMTELTKAKDQYNTLHQTYKECVQLYLDSKTSIAEAESKLVATTNKRSITEPPLLAKKIKIADSKQQRNTGPTISDPIKVPDQKLQLSNQVTKSVIVNQPQEQLSTETNTNVDSSVLQKRQAIDSDPHVEICPFDLQGTCKDVECKYRHFSRD